MAPDERFRFGKAANWELGWPTRVVGQDDLGPMLVGGGHGHLQRPLALFGVGVLHGGEVRVRLNLPEQN